MKVSDIAIFEDDDPYKSASIDLPDSDEEDDIIKPNDNLVLVGHVEGATPILEVYGMFKYKTNIDIWCYLFLMLLNELFRRKDNTFLCISTMWNTMWFLFFSL